MKSIPRVYTSFEFVVGWIELECNKCEKHFWRRSYRVKTGSFNFCSFECRNRSPHKKRGEGKFKNLDGYVYILFPNYSNPNKNKNKRYILEHRLVMEKILGRYLTKEETVHHINGIRDDNRPENLELRVKGNHPKGISLNDMMKTLESSGYFVSRKK